MRICFLVRSAGFWPCKLKYEYNHEQENGFSSRKGHLGTKIVLMSPKEKNINGTSMLKLDFNSYFVNCTVATRCMQRIGQRERLLESCKNIFCMRLDRDFFPDFLEFAILDQKSLAFCLCSDTELASKTKFLMNILDFMLRKYRG